MIGQTLAHYKILDKLGAGGMGVVYRARDTRLDRNVAVKVLPKDFARDPKRLARFKREAKSVAALSHANILAIHDFGESDGITYAVTELLQGDTLGEYLEQRRPPVHKAVEISRQIAEGLAAAHNRGIIHRDLKPDNVFVERNGQVKILDFGLAKTETIGASADHETEVLVARTDPGTVLGSVGYMSPEQVRGQAATARSDIFSLGVILYEMLAGRRAFKAETPAETMTAILRQEPEELDSADRHLPAPLARIVRRCIEKRPEAPCCRTC